MANTWRSERLIYRAVDKDDEPFLAVQSEDAESWLNAAPFLATPRSKADSVGSREWIEKQMLGVIVCLPATAPTTTEGTPSKPTPIGHMTLSQDPKFAHHRNGTIGITLHRDYHGQGYGSEALKWVLRWGFRWANLHRIEIGAFAFNERAWKLYERLGFKHESRKRDQWWHDGRYWDGVELAMLEHEWRELYGGEQDAVVGASKTGL